MGENRAAGELGIQCFTSYQRQIIGYLGLDSQPCHVIEAGNGSWREVAERMREADRSTRLGDSLQLRPVAFLRAWLYPQVGQPIWEPRARQVQILPRSFCYYNDFAQPPHLLSFRCLAMASSPTSPKPRGPIFTGTPSFNMSSATPNPSIYFQVSDGKLEQT